MILKKLNFIVFFCFLLFRFPVYSKVKISDSDTIRLNKNFHFIDLKTETYYFSEKDMPLEKVLLKNFKPRDSLYFSYATGWIWVKFIIKNESLKNTFILSATASQIAGYYLYKPESNGYVLTPPKINHPEDGREINSNIPSFYISLKKGEVKTFFMKVRVEEEVFRCNYIIRDITHFIEFSQINYSILGIYIGVLLIIITINIFYSIALKDSLFFIYATYIIGVLMATLAFEGFIWMLTPNTILGYHICYFILRFWTDSLLFFTIKLSDVKKYRPKLYKTICVYLIYHEVIMAVLQLTDFFNFRLVLAGKWEMVNCMITMLLVFIAIISSYKN
ncbi:MAG TPA: 7TM diverse intracellular signaling domain-containing protein, partial [Bacteroidia bacterium]|nr:7TM diverse intracellular signaling domain-containing protein [Bacteroidia bacterium]